MSSVGGVACVKEWKWRVLPAVVEETLNGKQ